VSEVQAIQEVTRDVQRMTESLTEATHAVETINRWAARTGWNRARLAELRAEGSKLGRALASMPFEIRDAILGALKAPHSKEPATAAFERHFRGAAVHEAVGRAVARRKRERPTP